MPHGGGPLASAVRPASDRDSGGNPHARKRRIRQELAIGAGPFLAGGAHSRHGKRRKRITPGYRSCSCRERQVLPGRFRGTPSERRKQTKRPKCRRGPELIGEGGPAAAGPVGAIGAKGVDQHGRQRHPWRESVSRSSDQAEARRAFVGGSLRAAAGNRLDETEAVREPGHCPGREPGCRQESRMSRSARQSRRQNPTGRQEPPRPREASPGSGELEEPGGPFEPSKSLTLLKV